MPRALRIVNFAKYNPPDRTVHSKNRGQSLKWVRWETDTHRDQDILDLPREERWVWPTLIDMASKPPFGEICDLRPEQLAREADIGLDGARHALRHLLRRGRVEWVNGEKR